MTTNNPDLDPAWLVARARELIKDSRESYFQDFEEELADIGEDLADALEKALADRAEVRREGYQAGMSDERLTHVPGWEDWMVGHGKGYLEGLEAACKVVCGQCRDNLPIKLIPNVVNQGIVYGHDIGNFMMSSCRADPIRRLMETTADQGQGEEGVGECWI